MHNDWKVIKKGEYIYGKISNHPNATSNGYVLEHRLVMENYLGRYLTSNEIVHHVDQNTKNNDISNLRVMSRKDHGHLHKRVLQMEQRTCPVCNVDFIRRPKGVYDKNRIPCCSRSCNGKRSKQIQINSVTTNRYNQ